MPHRPALSDHRAQQGHARAMLSARGRYRYFAPPPRLLMLCLAAACHFSQSNSSASLKEAGSTSVQCSVCEFMVTELDNALHAAQASNRSVSTGFRLRNDGRRDLKAVPAWESDVGFLEAVEAVCSEAVLGQFGMRPMKPNARGEAQWQLVHVSSSKYTGQDSGYRGYKQLQPSPLGSSDSSSSSSSSSRAGLEPAHDVLRDYVDGCRAVAEEHDEALQAVLRHGAKRTQWRPDEVDAASTEGWMWLTEPSILMMKRDLCAQRTQLCPSTRRWMHPDEDDEMRQMAIQGFHSVRGGGTPASVPKEEGAPPAPDRSDF